ncbi:MAG: very short patch repair endonuclease [Thermoplasmata archaeon]
MSRERRSALMSRVRGVDTLPERKLRSTLRRAGIRFRSYRRIKGVKVDLVLPDKQTAVLVHGCFWHGCRYHYTAPKSRAAFWQRKVRENRERDRRQCAQLRRAGWRVWIVWEHSLEAPDRLISQLAGLNPVPSRPRRSAPSPRASRSIPGIARRPPR